ncbi:MAG TPA: bacterial transcriptional activator domain-containing protein [Sedimentibacter sp.]|nr:bacterial transcriptional activator domain-containing protein [Sedimentibacter sp.]
MKFYISTLGEFDIKVDGQSILRDSNRMYRIYKLFEYFLTFRNKKLLPETIIDNVLSDSESEDPKNMLRTQIFRLRKIINALIPKGELPEKYMNLNFTNGYYCLEIGENTIVDIDVFENLIQKGDKEREYDIESAIESYQNAISLYKGLYLSDNAYEVWLVPTRNYYQRLFLKTLNKYIDLLKRNEENEKIVNLCEKSLLIEPFEESIHIELIEALLKIGQNKSAMQHYEYALNMLEKELDAKPSAKFINYINIIQNYTSRNNDLDIEAINKSLEEELPEGAMYCSLEYFKFLFNLQKRKSKRNNEYDYLLSIMINSNNNKSINDVFSVLKKSLRKGDVFTSWNDNQILVMLHNVKENGTETIKERLTDNLINYTRINRNEIRLIFQPVSMENTIL